MRQYELIAPCHFGMEAVLKREILDMGYEISCVEDGKVTGHDNPPYEIIIEFPEALEISGVRYVPRFRMFARFKPLFLKERP